LYLQKAAQKIVSDFNGVFPQDEKVLQTLPGIGEYTSKAIVCFAFDKQVAVVDTNVRKVVLTQLLSVYSSFPPHPNPLLKEREYNTLKDAPAVVLSSEKIDEKIISQIATQLLPQGRAYEWNQALMDYAGSVLKKEKILIPKQSKFKDSDRYYRGQIMKLLIEKKEVSINQLHEHFNKNEIVIDWNRLEKIIAGLKKDALIKKNDKKLLLP
jgi:A/G-specific adenine glycosylase